VTTLTVAVAVPIAVPIGEAYTSCCEDSSSSRMMGSAWLYTRLESTRLNSQTPQFNNTVYCVHTTMICRVSVVAYLRECAVILLQLPHACQVSLLSTVVCVEKRVVHHCVRLPTFISTNRSSAVGSGVYYCKQ
jgi:hypothetical protein